MKAASKGPLAALTSDPKDAALPPAVLLPYQQRWVADPSPLKICEKSRRIGMTWAEASDNVLIAASSKPAGGQSVYYLGTDKDMTEEYIETCAMWSRAFDYAASEIGEGLWPDGEDKYIQTFTIRYPQSGHKITALASVPSKLRGRQGILVGDEAAFHKDLRKLLKAALAFLLWGGKVRLLSTHEGVDNTFNEIVQEVRSGRRRGVVHKVTFREAVEEGLFRRVCLRLGREWSQQSQDDWVRQAYEFYGDDAAEELDVIPSQSGGAFLPMSLIEARMSADTPIVRGKWTHEFALKPAAERELDVQAWCEEQLLPHLAALDPQQRHGFGQDFGRTGDLTVIAALAEDPTLVRRCRLWVELSNCPFEQQRQILFFVVQRLPRFRAGALDATGNGAYLAEVTAQQFGSTRIEQIKLSEGFYLEHMPRLKAALQDGNLTDLPKDREVRDDLRAIRVIDGVPKLARGKTQEADGPKLQRHGDGAIAVLLAHYAMSREVVPMEGTGTGDQRVGEQLEDFLEM